MEKKAWDTFSVWVRTRNIDSEGFTHCYTCERPFHWKGLDAGHWIEQTKKIWKFDERNVRPQCRYCNRYLRGNLRAYTLKLQNEIGKEVCEEMENRRFEVKKFTVDELQEIIVKYGVIRGSH